jgi:hypothetical protein
LKFKIDANHFAMESTTLHAAKANHFAMNQQQLLQQHTVGSIMQMHHSNVIILEDYENE